MDVPNFVVGGPIGGLSPVQMGERLAPDVKRAIKASFPLAAPFLLFLLRNLPAIISLIVQVLALRSRDDPQVSATVSALPSLPDHLMEEPVIASYRERHPNHLSP